MLQAVTETDATLSLTLEKLKCSCNTINTNRHPEFIIFMSTVHKPEFKLLFNTNLNIC